jgi:predicted MFS family arabinose efflux permease
LIVASSAAIVTALRLILGFVLDRIRRTVAVMTAASVLMAASLALLSMTTDPAALVIFVAAWSLGGCFGPLMESLMLSQRFGLVSFGALLGTMGVVEMFGFLAGPWLGGYLFDRSGNYDVALLVYAGALALAMVLFLSLPLVAPGRSTVRATA